MEDPGFRIHPHGSGFRVDGAGFKVFNKMVSTSDSVRSASVASSGVPAAGGGADDSLPCAHGFSSRGFVSWGFGTRGFSTRRYRRYDTGPQKFRIKQLGSVNKIRIQM